MRSWWYLDMRIWDRYDAVYKCVYKWYQLYFVSFHFSVGVRCDTHTFLGAQFYGKVVSSFSSLAAWPSPTLCGFWYPFPTAGSTRKKEVVRKWQLLKVLTTGLKDSLVNSDRDSIFSFSALPGNHSLNFLTCAVLVFMSSWKLKHWPETVNYIISLSTSRLV